MERYNEEYLATLDWDLRGVAELPWPVPMKFKKEEEPDFPADSLPEPVYKYVTALAESTQTDIRMAGLLSLGVLATAAQSKYTVEVTPDWREPLCLFTMAVAEPGERKSAVLSALLDPVREYEREVRELEAGDVAWSAGMRAALEKCVQNEQRGVASTAPGTPEFERASEKLRKAAEEMAAFQPKAPCRLLVDDATPEKLVDLMDSQGGCVTLASSEGGIFSYIAAGRYESVGNLDVYLKAHAGDEIVVDRIGRGVNQVKDPRLTVMLTVQPTVLREVTGNSQFRGRGLTARFLYVKCPTALGRRKSNPDPVPQELKEDYRGLVRFLLTAPWRGTVTLSPEAQEIRLEMQDHIERKLSGPWANMRDWGGKLIGAMVRIAAILHTCTVSGDPTRTPISVATMSCAALFALYLGKEAEKVYDAEETSALEQDARYIAELLDREGWIYGLRRELYRRCSGRFPTTREFGAALGELEDRGYIREATVRPLGGRSTKYFVVNPRLVPVEATLSLKSR